MSEGAEAKKGRTVFIGMDGSKHAIYAFECKDLFFPDH